MHTTFPFPPTSPPHPRTPFSPFSFPPASPTQSPRQSPFVMQSGTEGPQSQPQLLPAPPPGWSDTGEGCPLPCPCREPWLRPAACAWAAPRLGRGCRVETAGSGPVSHRSPRRRWGVPALQAPPRRWGAPPRYSSDPFCRGGPDSAPPACTHALGPASAWGGGPASTDRGDSAPSSLSSPFQFVPVPPASPVPLRRSLSGLLPPVLVRWDEPGDQEGCYGVKGTRTRVCGAGGGGTGGLGAVMSHVLCVPHMYCVFTQMISVLCHTRPLFHTCVLRVCFTCAVCVIYVVPMSYVLVGACVPRACDVHVPARATRVPAMHRCVQGP